jgi:hypothetical protein
MEFNYRGNADTLCALVSLVKNVYPFVKKKKVRPGENLFHGDDMFCLCKLIDT